MDKEEKKYVIEFSKEELNLINDVFTELTCNSLEKWTTLLPPKGEYRSRECFQQWLITGMFNEVRYRAARALGLETPISDEDSDIYNRSSFEVYKKEIENADKNEG